MARSREFMLKLYKSMVEMRKFENRVAEEYAAGYIGNTVHLYVGQEAIGAAVCLAMREDDYMLPSFRGHGTMLGKGCDMNRLMAELFGKSDGYCKGKGGSMHMAEMNLGILGSNGILTSGVSMSVGAGHAAKYNGKGQVVTCFFGDGSSNRGPFHEALNFASYMKLPVIYVLENNSFAISADIRNVTNVEHLAVRAQGYGIPGYTIDGNNPLEVYDYTVKAMERARAGEGPTLLECVTWRHRGHWEGDPDNREFKYRKREEHEAWMKRDPIPATRKMMIEEGLCTAAELDQLEREVDDRVEAAAQFAKDSPWPDVSETFTDVYA